MLCELQVFKRQRVAFQSGLWRNQPGRSGWLIGRRVLIFDILFSYTREVKELPSGTHSPSVPVTVCRNDYWAVSNNLSSSRRRSTPPRFIVFFSFPIHIVRRRGRIERRYKRGNREVRTTKQKQRILPLPVRECENIPSGRFGAVPDIAARGPGSSEASEAVIVCPK